MNNSEAVTVYPYDTKPAQLDRATMSLTMINCFNSLDPHVGMYVTRRKAENSVFHPSHMSAIDKCFPETSLFHPVILFIYRCLPKFSSSCNWVCYHTVYHYVCCLVFVVILYQLQKSYTALTVIQRALLVAIHSPFNSDEVFFLLNENAIHVAICQLLKTMKLWLMAP